MGQHRLSYFVGRLAILAVAVSSHPLRLDFDRHLEDGALQRLPFGHSAVAAQLRCGPLRPRDLGRRGDRVARFPGRGHAAKAPRGLPEVLHIVAHRMRVRPLLHLRLRHRGQGGVSDPRVVRRRHRARMGERGQLAERRHEALWLGQGRAELVGRLPRAAHRLHQVGRRRPRRMLPLRDGHPQALHGDDLHLGSDARPERHGRAERNDEGVDQGDAARCRARHLGHRRPIGHPLRLRARGGAPAARRFLQRPRRHQRCG
mmetsp:Transcript_110796/g.320204  ORF Transcript_110796/g.320204 Transcript_110796/m.320204 type:complete len:259 (+) Transcript_110796:64-840(+)